jgi:hypothetical protein
VVFPLSFSYQNFEFISHFALKEQLQITQPIKFLTPKEIQNIIQDINPRKAPGYDLITGRILKEMPRKDIVHYYNGIFPSSMESRADHNDPETW